MYTEEVNKISLSSNDDKRIQTYDKITTYPYGTNIFKICENEMLLKNKFGDRLNNSQVIINESQVPKNNSQVNRNELHELIIESKSLRNNSQVTRNESLVLRNNSEVTRNELHELINESQSLRNNSQVLRNEVQEPRNEA